MPKLIFPSPDTADEDGLLGCGGNLSRETLLEAYSQGIFPWPIEYDEAPPNMLLAWFAPPERTIIDFDDFRISRRVARRLRSGQYSVTFNQAFAEVIRACAAPRKDEAGTWITPDIIDAFEELHQIVRAHSVETWHRGQLVGGLYGVTVGASFSGESMFHRATDASKIALASLMERLQQRGFDFFDAQTMTPHIQRMGGKDIPRDDFLARLRRARKKSVTLTD